MKTKLRFGILLAFVALMFSASENKLSLTSDQIIKLVNQDRIEQGLSPLASNRQLSLAASSKAQDMIAKKYFAHISPDGTKPWQWMKSLGYNYIYAGENLATGFSDAQDLTDSWMSSPAHRANILSPFYSETGLAVIQSNDTTYIVQFFGNTSGQVTLRQ